MRKQILILLLLLRLRLRRRRLDYYYYYDYYLRLLVLPTTTTTTAITMHWLLASLLVLPPPTAPLPLVGPKRDARLTELVFQQSLSVCLCMAHPKLYHMCMEFSCRASVVDIALWHRNLPDDHFCVVLRARCAPALQHADAFLARNGLFFEFRFSPHGHRNPFPDEHSYEIAKRKRQL